MNNQQGGNNGRGGQGENQPQNGHAADGHGILAENNDHGNQEDLGAQAAAGVGAINLNQPRFNLQNHLLDYQKENKKKSNLNKKARLIQENILNAQDRRREAEAAALASGKNGSKAGVSKSGGSKSGGSKSGGSKAGGSKAGGKSAGGGKNH